MLGLTEAEARIEDAAERKMDRLDRSYLCGDLTDKEYLAAIRELDAEAARKYAELLRGQLAAST